MLTGFRKAHFVVVFLFLFTLDEFLEIRIKQIVIVSGFECRCGGLFCAVHRYSDKHDCSFNYREMGAQEIRRNNPVVVGEKIQKI